MMRKVRLLNTQSPGDIVTLTAAVRDIKKHHGDNISIGIHPRTSCKELWEHNPYIDSISDEDAEKFPDSQAGGKDRPYLRMEYPLIHQSNATPHHFIHGFAAFLGEKLGMPFPLTEFKGDIHISSQEMAWISQVEETGHKGPFWIIVAGGKEDFTCKWWNPDWYQEVVNKLRGRVQFVQVGEARHWHNPLKNVINLLGKTDIRQLIRLVYHADGILCPVTFAMHLAAAVPTKESKPRIRACVVIAGGREPNHWEAYPGHQFLHTVGALSCCDHGGCWRSRCQKINDGDAKDRENVCEYPVDVKPGLCIPKCMVMITPDKVVQAIHTYYEGGTLQYG
jgi:ADP-heptose:LPS heptosyltransferase